MSYRDQEAKQGPGIDLRGGRWRPEFNDLIASMLSLEQRIIAIARLALQMMQDREDGDGATKM